MFIGGAAKRDRREKNDRAWLAWHIAALQRVAKMPKFESMISEERPKEKQDWKTQRDIARMWTIALGGKVH